MAASIAKVTRLNGSSKLVQTAAKGLSIAHDLRCVVATILFHFRCGYKQGRQSIEVVITGGAREDTTVGCRPVFLLALSIQIAQDDTALGTWKSLVGAAGHPCSALVQWGLKLTARNQSKNVRAIIEQWNIFRFAEGGNFRDRLGEEEEALRHDHELRRHL